LALLGRVKYPLGQPQEFDSDYSYAWSTSFQGEVIDARNGRPVTGYEIKLITKKKTSYFLF
jgi:hypothetical protein